MAPLGVAMAQTPASVIGAYNAKGDGPGMQMIYDNAGGAGGSHPVGYGAVPEAAAEAESGFGHAVSSVIWPGPLVGNLGTAAPLLPGVGQLPSQITGPVLPLLHDNGNDPIKAEATSGSKPDATYGAPNTAAYLAAHADEAKVTAHAETRGFDAQAGGYAGDVVSDGVTNASASAVTATGSSVASNIVMAAGLLTIDSVVSKASATTDGTRSSGTSRITVSGMKIGGVPATVDDQGLHIQGQGGSVSPLNDGLSQFAQAGLKVTLTKPQEVHDGAAESIMAGSLVVSFTPPNNPRAG